MIEELAQHAAEAIASIPDPDAQAYSQQRPRGPLALLRFLARNGMLNHRYARLVARLVRRRWLTPTGRRLRLDGLAFIGPKVTLEIGKKASVRLGRWMWIGKGTKIRCHEGEVRILMARLAGQNQVRAAGPTGWGGDRYRVYRTPGGPALVWVVMWDDPASSQRFERAYGTKLRATSRPGYRASAEHLDLDRKPATRYVLAPAGWNGWSSLPRPSIAR